MRVTGASAVLLGALLVPSAARAQEADPMARFLATAADDALAEARTDGALRAVLGASLTSFSLLAPRATVADAPRILGAAAGGILLTTGVVEFFGPQLVTPIAEDYAARRRAGVPAAVARAQTEAVWSAAAAQETRIRRVMGWLTAGLGVGLATAAVLVATREGDAVERGYTVGFGLAAAATAVWSVGLIAREGSTAAALRRWRAARGAGPTATLSPWGAGALLTLRF